MRSVRAARAGSEPSRRATSLTETLSSANALRIFSATSGSDGSSSSPPASDLFEFLDERRGQRARIVVVRTQNDRVGLAELLFHAIAYTVARTECRVADLSADTGKIFRRPRDAVRQRKMLAKVRG